MSQKETLQSEDEKEGTSETVIVDKKYIFRACSDGSVRIDRYDLRNWVVYNDCPGINAIHSLVYALSDARGRIGQLVGSDLGASLSVGLDYLMESLNPDSAQQVPQGIVHAIGRLPLLLPWRRDDGGYCIQRVMAFVPNHVAARVKEKDTRFVVSIRHSNIHHYILEEAPRTFDDEYEALVYADTALRNRGFLLLQPQTE